MRSQVTSPGVRVRTAGRYSNARVVAAAARGDAADVVQATWLRLLEHLTDIRNADGIGAWLATTARREALLTLRRAARCEPSDDVDVMCDTPGLDAGLLRQERLRAVAAALHRPP